MVKFFLTFFVISILFSPIFANTEREKILLRQARGFVFQGRYDKANSIYKGILKQNPNNKAALIAYIDNLLRNRKIDEAEKVFNDYKRYLSDDDKAKLDVRILLYKNKIKEAENLALKYLKNDYDVNYYTMIFSQFRQYETVEKICLAALKFTSDSQSIHFKLANNYEKMQKYKKALQEYILVLKENKSYFLLIKSKVINIIKEKPNLINLLEQENSKDIKTLYVLALFTLENNNQALLQAQELTRFELKKVIEERENQKDYNNVIKLYQMYYNKSKNLLDKVSTKLEMAKIYLKKNDLENAKILLLQIYDNKNIRNKKVKANLESRTLLAKIALMENENDKVAIRYLKEAKKYAFNTKERVDIDFKILYLAILNSKFNDARNSLDNLMKHNKINDEAIYYKYLIYKFQNNKKADTLLVDLMIKIPQSELTNKALLLSYYLSLADNDTKEIFIKAFQKKNLYKYEAAHNYLKKCFKNTGKEEFLYLSMMWYLEENESIPDNLLSQAYKNEYIKKFTEYLKVIKNKSNFKEKAIDYLKDNPSSIFAPYLRGELNVDEQIN